MTDETTTEPAAVDETEVADEATADVEPAVDDPDTETEPETFPREVVEKLRQENGKYRQRAQRADDLARRLHTELVRATGRLADPSDLEFDENPTSTTRTPSWPPSANCSTASRTLPPADRSATSDKASGAEPPSRSVCCRCSKSGLERGAVDLAAIPAGKSQIRGGHSGPATFSRNRLRLGRGPIGCRRLQLYEQLHPRPGWQYLAQIG